MSTATTEKNSVLTVSDAPIFIGLGFVPLFQLTSAPAEGRLAPRGTRHSPRCQVRDGAGSLWQRVRSIPSYPAARAAKKTSKTAGLVKKARTPHPVPSCLAGEWIGALRESSTNIHCTPWRVKPSRMFYIRAFLKLWWMLGFFFCVCVC